MFFRRSSFLKIRRSVVKYRTASQRVLKRKRDGVKLRSGLYWQGASKKESVNEVGPKTRATWISCLNILIMSRKDDVRSEQYVRPKRQNV
jgi:hypothetical protein